MNKDRKGTVIGKFVYKNTMLYWGFGGMIGLPLSMMFANMVLRKSTQEQLPRLSLVWGFLLIFLTIVFMIL